MKQVGCSGFQKAVVSAPVSCIGLLIRVEVGHITGECRGRVVLKGHKDYYF